MPDAPLVGDTVVLRAFRDDDVGMVTDLATDPYVPRIGSLPFRADDAEALAYIGRQRGRTTEGVGWSFCVADRATDQALGGIGLWVVVDDPSRMTIGYAVAPRSRGRGAAGEALRVLTAFAWTMPAVGRLDLFVEPWNVASVRTAERCGYGREEVLTGAGLQDRRVDLVRFTLRRLDEC